MEASSPCASLRSRGCNDGGGVFIALSCMALPSSEGHAELDACAQQEAGEHGLVLAVKPLPVAELCALSAVSRRWRGASEDALAAVQALDLRPYARYLTDAALVALLAKTPLLRALNVSTCKLCTDAALARIPASCPLLTDLNLACLPCITADGVAAVADALGSGLTSLELAGCSCIAEAELVGRFSRFLELDDDEDGLFKVQG
mmetsp:Transcript_100091/g.311861  ORF Transcript_100091/g.311861 Transcript_100091/m.311861 type:complete len:204 (-) Transcript_100091:76-687(-)